MAVGWIYREGWGLACERDDEAREREKSTQAEKGRKTTTRPRGRNQ
jgi:hypothetical protein